MAPAIAATDAINVNAAHIRGLTASGPGRALMWDGHDVFTATADVADDGTVLEIINYEDATAMHEQSARRGQPANPATIAADVTGQARTRLSQWRHTQKMMRVTGPYTTALRPHGIHRHQVSHPATNDGYITTAYRITPTGATASITMPYFPDSITPITITIADPRSGTDPAYTVTVPRRTPPAAVAALIAAATGLIPHTATGYRAPNDTGFPDSPHYLEVEPAHARALAAHGPGWSIMWNDRHAQPIIVPTERGDDGFLLEICTYEGMFNLRGQHDNCDDCTTCDIDDNPDFDAIADDMTDILGDFYSSRDAIADYMCETVPYTRALTEHGFHRLSQGTLHDATFDQHYRSPDGHLVMLKIPVAPNTPLTIAWSYLRLANPDAPTPVTVIPTDTTPADVAALIAAHIAIHPPATT
ncbi:hypothetical protein [Nonomuraea sp. NPDC049625]|uniref:hypothetical protein n=1 Tax=Nonomuraea sp. NPDC049625 TaxID=3155775 RepID=UPI0034222E46